MANAGELEKFLPRLEWPKICYGIPYPEACNKHIKSTLGCSRVYALVSGSLSRNTDVVERLEAAMGKESIVGLRRGMKPHTLFSEVIEIMEEVERSEADCILTVGGGSLIDAAKIIPFAIANKAGTIDKIDELLKESLLLSPIGKEPTVDWRKYYAPSTISVVCVPTTLSGGEFSIPTGGTNDYTMHKRIGYDPSSPGPKLIIWDPEVTMTTPLRVWLSTGMRAVDHCIEGICALYPTAESSENSLRGLKLLIPALIKIKRSPDDIEARLDAQKGGRYSMVQLKCGVAPGGSHGIGHQLGPYGVPHGETSCVMMPSVLKYNSGVRGKEQAELAKILWQDDTTAEMLKKRGLGQDEKSALAGIIAALVSELSLPGSLHEVGIGRDKFEVIAESSLHDTCCKNNPIPLTQKEQVMEILEMAA